MIPNISILISSAVLGGLLAMLIRKDTKKAVFNLLTFSGSFLLSITLIHIIPELFANINYGAETGYHYEQGLIIGTGLIFGFFIQKILEFFSFGIEHGHAHHHDEKLPFSPVIMIIALSIHAFMEGTILTEGHSIHHNHHHEHSNLSVVMAVALHKIPAAFVLMSILLTRYNTKAKPILYLTIFALASPLGLIVNQLLHDSHLLTRNFFLVLYAVVAGNLLHIGTVIFFESDPEHSPAKSKIWAVLLGIFIAVAMEQFL